MKSYYCRHCQKAQSFIEHTRSVYCENAHCQRAKVQHYLNENRKRLTAQLISECEQYIQDNTVQRFPSSLTKALGNQAPTVALLPANKNPLIELDEQRKQTFLQHLRSIYQDIQQNNPTANKVYVKDLHPPLIEEEPQLLGNACATCMGACCKHGQTHAFIDYPSLKQILDILPTEVPEQALIDLYSDYLPVKSYQDACVFQGNKGCVLPREMRSFTCNNYLCNEILTYRKQIKQAGSSLTFAAAVEKEKIIFSSIYSDQHFIRVNEKELNRQ